MHPLFLDYYEQLLKEVEDLKNKFPDGYKNKNATKRLATIEYLVFEKIPSNPSDSIYRQGSTLGDKYKDWFRAKFYQQYRLFFRFDSKSKIIIFAWVNDEKSKRAYESIQ